jgi:hypothetical protein
MLDSKQFDIRYAKVASALGRAKIQMLSEQEEATIRPLLERMDLTLRVSPVDNIGPTSGANQIPLMVYVLPVPSSYTCDLPGAWIDATDEDAIVLWLKEWVKSGVETGKLL